MEKNPSDNQITNSNYYQTTSRTNYSIRNEPRPPKASDVLVTVDAS